MDGGIGYVLVALIALAGPVILALITGRQRRIEKREDWKRQDEVAELLLKQNVRTANAVKVTNQKIDEVAQQTTEIHNQAVEIHGLVNSAMSAEMRRSLESTQALLVVLEELKEFKEHSGITSSAEAIDRINSTKSIIAELKASLHDRLEKS